MLAAPAHAATIERKADLFADDDFATPYYLLTAAPGERNAVTVERVDGGLRVTDAGAPLSGCADDGPNAVRCDEKRIIVRLGDGDDSVTGDGLMVEASGGPGNDHLVTTSRVANTVLAGDEGDDELVGGPELDFLFGGAGADRVSGGDGNDAISDGIEGPSDDTLDGGPGRDTLLYRERTEPLTVDLAVGTGGQPGEHDALANIEDVVGGAGRDALRGTEGTNRLVGTMGGSASGDDLDGRGGDDDLQGSYGGPDVLVGGDGDDRLNGFNGGDRYDGGAGDDELDGATGAELVCGPGDDAVEVRDRSGQLVPADCEQVEAFGALVRILRGERTRLRIGWKDHIRPPCRLRVNGRTLEGRRAKRTVTLAPGTERVRLHPSQRCRGPFGSPYLRSSFRLTS